MGTIGRRGGYVGVRVRGVEWWVSPRSFRMMYLGRRLVSCYSRSYIQFFSPIHLQYPNNVQLRNAEETGNLSISTGSSIASELDPAGILSMEQC